MATIFVECPVDADMDDMLRFVVDMKESGIKHKGMVYKGENKFDGLRLHIILDAGESIVTLGKNALSELEIKTPPVTKNINEFLNPIIKTKELEKGYHER